MTVPTALTIAGSDSGGGAGIQADLKSFSALGVYGASIITALTAQNTQAVHAIHAVPTDFIDAQIDAVCTDIRVDAVKIGMLGTQEICLTVADALQRHQLTNVVLDPVMVAKSGDKLLSEDAIEAIQFELLPFATLITPNIPEAAALTGLSEATDKAEMRATASVLLEYGCNAVLLKGGHMSGDEVSDLLMTPSRTLWHSNPRIETTNTHGTGCSLSSGIAAGLARGLQLDDAVARANTWLHRAIATADELDVGRGHGPVHHFHELW